MKKHKVRSPVLFVFVVILLAATLSSCYRIQEKQYYADESNFITDTAVVESILYNEDTNTIYLWLDQIDAAYQDYTFKIQGQNASVALSDGILQKVGTGNEITYISAPGYFGDGYCMPIVAISVGEESLLEFSEGYNNLLASYE